MMTFLLKTMTKDEVKIANSLEMKLTIARFSPLFPVSCYMCREGKPLMVMCARVPVHVRNVCALVHARTVLVRWNMH